MKVSISISNSNSNLSLDQLTQQVKFLKDNLVQIMEDRRVLDDISWLRKKVEYISSSMQNIKQEDSPTSGSKHSGMMENSGRFVDTHTFNEFTRIYQKEVNSISEKFEEHKNANVTLIVSGI